MCWWAASISPWRRRSCFAPLLFSLWILAASAKRECNGAEEFCELPLDYFTFPGTHNSGAFNLSEPTKMSVKDVGVWKDFLQGFGIRQWKECYYEHHLKNYLRQLEAGVRFFSPDFCLDDKKEIVNCRSGTGERTDTAYGEKWTLSLQAIQDYLRVYKQEIVMIRPENMWDKVTAANIQESVEKVFGACHKSETGLGDLQAKSVPGCLSLSDKPTDLNSITLGALLDRNVRVVFSSVGYKKTYAHTLEQSKWVDDFSHRLETYPDTLPSVSSQVKERQAMAIVEIDLFRKQLPHAGFVMCNGGMAEELNEAMLPGDNAELRHSAPEGTECETSKCAGYRSKLEVIHQKILSKGYTLGNVNVDYTKHGDLRRTLKRMNMANYRRWKGLPEPGVEWYELPWGIALLITAPSLVLLIICCIVGHIKPQWCPSCIEKCFGCKKRQRKKQRRREKALEALNDAGAIGPGKETNNLSDHQWPTGGFNGNGQAPPVGIYGQPQSIPGNPAFQGAPPGSPWTVQGAPAPGNPWTVQAAPQAPATQYLQPPGGAAFQGFDPSASAPVGGYGGQRWPAAHLPAAPPDHQSAMTASTPVNQWGANPASFPQGVAPTPGRSDFGISTHGPAHSGLFPAPLRSNGYQATGHWGQLSPRGHPAETE